MHTCLKTYRMILQDQSVYFGGLGMQLFQLLHLALLHLVCQWRTAQHMTVDLKQQVACSACNDDCIMVCMRSPCALTMRDLLARRLRAGD